MDGLFYLAVKHEGRTWPHYGRFLRMDRPRCAHHTWVSEATKGVESTVTVTFEPKGNQTEVTLRHTGLPMRKSGERIKTDGRGVCQSSPSTSSKDSSRLTGAPSDFGTEGRSPGHRQASAPATRGLANHSHLYDLRSSVSIRGFFNGYLIAA